MDKYAVLATGRDFEVILDTDPEVEEDLILKCTECEWKINLNLLDTIEDIEAELAHHREGQL